MLGLPQRKTKEGGDRKIAILIKTIHGYRLLYEESSRKFLLEDSDFVEVASAATQDEAEAKAKTLSKQDFKRTAIVWVGPEGQVNMGQLTSLNRDDRCAWVSMEHGSYSWSGGREKIHLATSAPHYYEATATNLDIVEHIKEKRATLEQIKADIEALRDTLEKPITLEYFGIKGR